MNKRSLTLKKILLGLLFFIFLMTLYYGLSITNRLYNSDEAYIVRAAQSIASGNILLKGFIGGNVSQYLGILLSCFFGIFVGYGPENIYLVIAFNYALLVSICCCFVACKSEGSLPKKLFILFAIIGLPTVDMELTMHNSTHIISYALTFASFYFVSESICLHSTRRNILFSFFLLTIAAIDDSFTVYFGVLPILLLCCIHIFLLENPQDVKKIAVLHIIVSLFSVFLSQFVLSFVESHGGLTLPYMSDRVFLSVENIFDNIGVSLRNILYCFSGDLSGRVILQKGTLFKVLPNTVLAGVCLYCLIISLKRFSKCSVRAQLLILCTLTGYAIVTFSNILSLGAQRYYMICYLSLALLLSMTDLKFKRNQTFLSVCMVAILLCSFISKMAPFSLKREENTFDKVAAYLEEHNLYHGYGEFWASHAVSVASNCTIQIGAIENRIDYPYSFLLNKEWYDGEAYFFVFTMNNVQSITEETIKNVYGSNYTLVQFDNICIMQYDSDISPYLTNPYQSQE